ncbi:MAG TPA: phage antirepressor N-terminal domain-containing protein [Bacteroidales bacterium]|nr:phage antirepressor N-terminal domain-containing protein [Bacteroidales bacterium]
MSNSKQATISAVAKVNNTEILVIENGEKRVAVKPLCEILGVDFSAQLQRIKSDEILGSTVGLSTTVGADGKQREMQTIPFKFVFGWLFTINPKNVAPEAKDAVVKFKLECYDALYNHFTRYADYVEQKQRLIEEHLSIVEAINLDFHEAKNRLLEAKAELNRARQLTFADYDAASRQLKMFTDNEMEG